LERKIDQIGRNVLNSCILAVIPRNGTSAWNRSGIR
jgi:hypothetical protein